MSIVANFAKTTGGNNSSKLTRNGIVALCATMLVAGMAHGDSSYSTEDNGATLVVTVPAGETNALDSAQVTSTITKIAKRGPGGLEAAQLTDYQGDFSLEGGVYKVLKLGDAGKENYENTLYVRDGASIWFAATNTSYSGKIFKNKKLVISGGNAPDAKGKLVSATYYYDSTTSKNKGARVSWGSGMTVTLEGDATFYHEGIERFIIDGTFDLGGHVLTISRGSGGDQFLPSGLVKNGGSIVIGKGEMMIETNRLDFDAPAEGETPTVVLNDNTSFNMKLAMEASGWKIVCKKSAVIKGNVYKTSVNTDVPAWNGTVECESTVNIANYEGSESIPSTVFNLKGNITGTAKMTIGPGWLNLHSQVNDYMGPVYAKGKDTTTTYPTPGSSGIGVYNGAACFPNASSITFDIGACFEIFGTTKTAVPKLTFTGSKDQTIKGGVDETNVADRSTIAGFTKSGTGILSLDSPVHVTGPAIVNGGTLKIPFRMNMNGSSLQEFIQQQPVLESLVFATGTKFDLDGNSMFIKNIAGSAVVTNAGTLVVTNLWTLRDPAVPLRIKIPEGTTAGEGVGNLAFIQGARFAIEDEKVFADAMTEDGIVVAEVDGWVVTQEEMGFTPIIPPPDGSISSAWSITLDSDGKTLRLRLGAFAAPSEYAHSLVFKFTGYAGSETLQNFPALVRLDPAQGAFSYGNCLKTGGRDLVFTWNDGTQNIVLDHEVDTWNPSGVSLVWVKVPQLTAGTKITAHYGCANPLIVEGKRTWSNGYAGVWHLNEGTDPLVDSTGGSPFYKTEGASPVYGADGILGGAVDFVQSGRNTMLDAADSSALDLTDQMTVELWTLERTAESCGVLSKRVGGGNKIMFYIYTGSGKNFGCHVSLNGTSATAAWCYAPSLSEWCHLTYTFDGRTGAPADNLVAYVNGAASASKSVGTGSLYNSSANLHLGNFNSGDNRNYSGKIDEVRISSVTRSADWIKASHDTVVNPAFCVEMKRGLLLIVR